MKSILSAAIAVVCACQPGYTRVGAVNVATDAPTLRNDGSKANLMAVVVDAAGKPGAGPIIFSAPYGDFNATGTPTATATADANGTARVAYACNVLVDPRCGPGLVSITVSWNGVSGTTTAILSGDAPSGGGGTDAGTDGGPIGPPTKATRIDSAGVSPSFITVSSAANPAQGLPGTATFAFSVSDPAGSAVAAAPVTFAQKAGEDLVTLSASTGSSDSAGKVTVNATSKNAIGVSHVVATLPNGASATVSLPVLGAPTAIVWRSMTPAVMGLHGSGIQETGLMTFAITDPLGTPVSGIQVNFTQNLPALISFGRASAITDANGIVSVAYAAGSEVGVSSIVATVVATGASTSHSVAVRGAKPSAAGFYFRCNQANLPVYTSTSRIESTTCTVRLSDRFGNRVGIPTPVNFAAEAGAISASVMTRGFDINNPTDPSEGTASVTFSTDMGNGTSPADVEPLPADPAQYPWPRQAEPRVANGQLVVNPRDQLVTIIAMTQGEEAFVDANHNGVLDIGETFIDQGDPFIDANDNGVYDQLYTGGPWELRFCGQGNTNCAAYQGPNGKWDSLTTIWVPTWVVFTGVTSAHIAAAGQPAPAADYSPACIPHNVSAFADIYIYDTFLNTPASGTGYNDPRVEQGNVGTRRHGFGPELDGWGAMGNLGVSFDYRIVSPAGGLCQSPAAPTAPTPCVQRLLFRNFDLGWRGTIETFNGGGTTTCPSTTVFKTSLQTNCAHGSYDIGYQFGTYAP